MKKEQLDVIRWTLDLADTLREGLEHIHKRQAQGHMPVETVQLFVDVVQAFAEIEHALKRALPLLPGSEELVEKTNALREGLSLMTSSYEDASHATPLATLQHTLLPRFQKWHRTLNETLRPLLAS